jgi:hypothetical protein
MPTMNKASEKARMVGSLGDHINGFAKQMIKERDQRLSNGDTELVEGRFNDILLVASVTSTWESIVDHHKNQCDQASRKYRRSKLFKKRFSKSKRQNIKRHRQLKRHMKTLPELDTTNHYAVLDWLNTLLPYAENYYARFDRTNVIRCLESAGYQANANTAENFAADNMDNFAGYIVGQALDGLKRHGSIHSMMSTFYGQWLEKFPA